ncbi:MAG TPA: hypothetical protein VEX68_11465 [Bryobacteraceae bacterium]|nr:hypothetical protein [Bryobacteraceae bacterium]
MRFLLFAIAFTLAASPEKPVGPVSSEDEFLVVTASALVDKQAVRNALGEDPRTDLVVIDIKVAPRADNKITVSLDDFTLISRKDGQRSQPLAPSQIAGTDALVVAQNGYGGVGGGIGRMNSGQGPMWGGVPGTGSRPRRIGGEDEGAVTGAATPGEAQATVTKDTTTGKANPLLDALKQKALPLRETTEPVTGLLYFFLEGKHKLKDLELIYKSPAGRMMLDFQK